MSTELPPAERRRDTGARVIYVLVVCAALASCALLVLADNWERGYAIDLHALAAHGLETGDPIRHRGLVIGRVRALALSPDRRQVHIQALLEPSYADLARTGTAFWIVRPQLDWQGVGGFEALLGGSYLACAPGLGEATRVFTCLDQPPQMVPPGALRLILQAPTSAAFTPGGAVLFRGMPIGRITDVRLAMDASYIEAAAFIDNAYRTLVRDNARFCPAANVHIDAGITGIELDLPALAQMTLGGVVLIGGPTPGEPVADGQRFILQDRAILNQQEAQAPLVLGTADHDLPVVLPASLRWTQERRLWFDGTRSREGVVVPFRGGVLGPLSLLRPPPGVPGAQLRIAEQLVDLRTAGLEPRGRQLAFLPWSAAGDGVGSWRVPTAPEDGRLRITAERALPIAAGSLVAGVDGWLLAEDLPSNLLPLGAPFLAAQDDALIGILVDAPWRIVPVID